MSEPFLGMIVLLPYNFAPRGFAFCSGQLMSIAQNEALYVLIGTTYGGDGVVTFGLPDLRSRVPKGTGQGPGLPNFVIGQAAGVESITLTTNQLPAHTHTITLNNLAATANAKNAAGNRQTPVGNVPAIEATGVTSTYSSSAADATMAAGAISVSGTATATAVGGGQPFQNAPPYLGLNFCIALEGIFPSQN